MTTTDSMSWDKDKALVQELCSKGDLDGALAVLGERERKCRREEDAAGLAEALALVVHIYYVRGELDEAAELLHEQEQLYHDLGDKDGLSRNLGNQANIAFANGDLDAAMALHRDEEKLCVELADRKGLQACLGNQAVVLRSRGQFDSAARLLERQKELCIELGDQHGLSVCVGNQALIAQAANDYSLALTLFEEQERICRRANDPSSLAICLANLAVHVGQSLGKPRDAIVPAQEALDIARQHGLEGLVQRIAPIVERLESPEMANHEFIMEAPVHRGAFSRPDDSAGGEQRQGTNERLVQAKALLDRRKPQEALDVLEGSDDSGHLVSNARGVCFIRLEQYQEAIDLYRKLVLSPDSVLLRSDVPDEFKVNYAIALALSGNMVGCKSILREMPQDCDPAEDFKRTIDEWEKSMSFWERTKYMMSGSGRPIEFDSPPGYVVAS